MRIILFILFFSFHSWSVQSQESQIREFRGVWIATVGNIDWPSSKNLSTEQQKKEIIGLLDFFHNMNFNAIIFQIRPTADAFYKSKYEPWSQYLTGESDKVPSPYYDPLAFIIDETHKRGMEFHAWLNPYRAVVNYKIKQSNPFPLTYEKPEWFISYGNNKYFDPGIPEVRSYTTQVVADIVSHYDVDAIHFDDYFYPYKINGEQFNDDSSFKIYGKDLYPNDKAAWRRNNVNTIIHELNHTIKAIKPWVQFGISPFGVWRNDRLDVRGSNTDAGQTNYDDLYADILTWIKEGWLDYVMPQVYWHMGQDKVDYQTIVKWWTDNSIGTNLYIGQAMYKLGSKKEAIEWSNQNPNEIEKQLRYNRSRSKVKGSAFFSANSFYNNPLKINQKLKEEFFQYPVLPPIADPDHKKSPQGVQNLKINKLKNKQFEVSWDLMPEHIEFQAVKFVVYLFDKNEKINLQSTDNLMGITGETSILFKKKEIQSGKTIVIIAVSKNNNLSQVASLKI